MWRSSVNTPRDKQASIFEKKKKEEEKNDFEHRLTMKTTETVHNKKHERKFIKLVGKKNNVSICCSFAFRQQQKKEKKIVKN